MIFSQQIIQSFIGSLLALFFAGFVWLIKSAYEKHRKTSLAIAKLERCYVENLGNLSDHLFLLDIWIQALRNEQNYAGSPFSDLIIVENELLDISDLKLVNLVIKTNFRQKQLNSDLPSMYKSWGEIYKTFTDNKITLEQLKSNATQLVPILEKMKEKITEIQSDLVKVIAYLRLSGEVRFHSLFTYIHLLNKDIWPVITSSKIERETQRIKEERKKSPTSGRF